MAEGVGRGLRFGMGVRDEEGMTERLTVSASEFKKIKSLGSEHSRENCG